MFWVLAIYYYRKVGAKWVLRQGGGCSVYFMSFDLLYIFFVRHIGLPANNINI